MSPKKAYRVMIGVIALAIIVGLGGFYVLDKSLSSKSLEIADTKAEQEAKEKQLETLEGIKQEIKELGFIDEIAKQVLPTEKSQANVVGELKLFATQTGIELDSIEFGEGAANNTNQQLSQTTTIEGLTGVRVLPATISLKGNTSYNQLLNFLEKIEANQRKIQVSSISITPEAPNSEILKSTIISLQIFLRV